MLEQDYNTQIDTIKYDMTTISHNTLPYPQWAEVSCEAIINNNTKDYKILFDYGQYYNVDNIKHTHIMQTLNINASTRKMNTIIDGDYNNGCTEINYSPVYNNGESNSILNDVGVGVKICKGIFKFLRLAIPFIFFKSKVAVLSIAANIVTAKQKLLT